MRISRRTLATGRLSAWACALLIAGAARAPATGQVLKQLTDGKEELPVIYTTMNDSGTKVWVASNSNQFGDNPNREYRIHEFDAATGTGVPRSTIAVGGPDYAYSYFAHIIAASDDGQWITFISRANPTGQNADRSFELFVMKTDGTQVKRLTSDTTVNAGSVTLVAISGSGDKIFFVSSSDLLGTNPDRHQQIYSVNRDGTGLAELTALPGEAYIDSLSVSDDGLRIAFSSNANPLSTNPEGNDEIFAVNGDGTGLRQLTSASTGASAAAVISGDGSTVAFESNAPLTGANPTVEIFAINWDGTGLRRLTTSTGPFGFIAVSFDPSITDDGQWVYFTSNQGTIRHNPDLSYEVYKVRGDGTGLTLVTNLNKVLYGTVVAGGGGRVTFFSYGTGPQAGKNLDGGYEISAIDGSGGTLRTLTDTSEDENSSPFIAADAARIFYLRRQTRSDESTNIPTEVYRMNLDGSGKTQVTTVGVASLPSATADGTLVAFSSPSNPLGTNSDGRYEVFTVRWDGTNLKQVTNGSDDAYYPRIAMNGSIIAFSSYANYDGTNADGNLDLWVVKPDGTGLKNLTASTSGGSAGARLDESGTWVVFTSDANLDGGNPDGSSEVWRIRTDGTGLQRITGDPTYSSSDPDVSASGDLIAYASQADPLGTNPEHNKEIFLYQVSTGTTRQLTVTADGENEVPTISPDGAWVYFVAEGDLFEPDPDEPYDLARLNIASGAIERVGGLMSGQTYPPYSGLSTDRHGSHFAFSGYGDWTDANPDTWPEVWLAEFTRAPMVTVSKSAPTLFTWEHEAGALRYDVIRGDVSNISHGMGQNADLGPVVCLENDSPDATIAGHEDATQPPPGRAFFYLYRGTRGLEVGPGSWGTTRGGGERIPGSGSCSP